MFVSRMGPVHADRENGLSVEEPVRCSLPSARRRGVPGGQGKAVHALRHRYGGAWRLTYGRGVSRSPSPPGGT
jgi:hypothetical protein